LFAEFFSGVFRGPYRFLIAAAVLAAILCLFPARVEEENQENPQLIAADPTAQPQIADLPAGTDLSERTSGGCMLHRTLYYAPCGHSVQRREALPAQLTGLSRQALEKEIGSVIPGAAVTGFSGAEVDIAVSTEIPCPLHWMLASGESGRLVVMQNRNGEAMEIVRETDVPLGRVPQEALDEIRQGKIFDDVQALEGYLESLSS